MELLEKDDGRYSGKALEAYVHYVLDGMSIGDIVKITGLSRDEVERMVRDGDWSSERGRARRMVGCSGLEYMRRRGMVLGIGLLEKVGLVSGKLVDLLGRVELEGVSVRDLERIGKIIRDILRVSESGLRVGGNGRVGGSEGIIDSSSGGVRRELIEGYGRKLIGGSGR